MVIQPNITKKQNKKQSDDDHYHDEVKPWGICFHMGPFLLIYVHLLWVKSLPSCLSLKCWSKLYVNTLLLSKSDQSKCLDIVHYKSALKKKKTPTPTLAKKIWLWLTPHHWWVAQPMMSSSYGYVSESSNERPMMWKGKYFIFIFRPCAKTRLGNIWGYENPTGYVRSTE